MRYCLRLAAVLALILVISQRGPGYIEAPMSLGAVIQQSTHIMTMVVTKVDREKNLIIYQKVSDIKGKHPQDVIKHNIGRGGLRPGEWEPIMKWAEPGKMAIFFHNGGASETFIGETWYQAYPQGEWWGMSHAEPFLLRSYSGKVDKLPSIVADILAGKEVIVPCMVDGDKEALHRRSARVQRLKASLKIQDYNPKRDFVGWGGEDIRRLAGMPGFDRYAALPKLDAEAQAISVVDFDNDGKPDFCLCGANRVVLVQNGGDAFVELTLPNLTTGARSAVWADANGDGLPDLLLATPNGPRLYTNLGKGQFRDDTRLLPREPAYNLTAAVWIDADCDGKPDILLANGFYGLKLYRNNRPSDALVKTVAPKWGPWFALGPFRDMEGKTGNFAMAFPPEKEGPAIDLKKGHKGKRDIPIAWQKKEYTDGSVNSLAEFGNNCATYLYREVEVLTPQNIPVSLGSDDTLTLWCNGEKLLSENVSRACAPDQNHAVLKLKPGKNHILLKICQGEGAYEFYFNPGLPGYTGDPWFVDESAKWGFTGEEPRGGSLAVADFTNDGRPDVLYSAGPGILYANQGNRFQRVSDSGLSFTTPQAAPALADFDGDGSIDIFLPQRDGACKLYRNTGSGRFTDVTAPAGDLAQPLGQAVTAAWGDFDNDGRPDLLVGCLRGANRYFRNLGNGRFEDKTESIGLSQKWFNTQAAAMVDLNGDGQLDLVLVNEGQETAGLLGAVPAAPSPRSPITLNLNGTPALNGGVVRVRSANGQPIATSPVVCDGRGSQQGLVPRFALGPGQYQIEILAPGSQPILKSIRVDGSPVNLRLNE